MSDVFREEQKYLITKEKYYELRRIFKQILHQDTHNGEEGYMIRSLYFDTLDDRDFEEKEEGIELRRKIRLRTYLNDLEFAQLEMKKKEGQKQKKSAHILSKEDAQCLINGELGVLLKQNQDYLADCYGMMAMHHYVPKSVVTYKREAFIAKENKIRITFDHDIRGTESNFDIFNRELIEYPLLDANYVVLEVKYNGFLLEYIKELLVSVEQNQQSVGKYSLSRLISKHYKF